MSYCSKFMTIEMDIDYCRRNVRKEKKMKQCCICIKKFIRLRIVADSLTKT